MRDPVPTVTGLRQAGRELAATLQIVQDGRPAASPPRFPARLPRGLCRADLPKRPGNARGRAPPSRSRLRRGGLRQRGRAAQGHTTASTGAALRRVRRRETCWWLPFDDDPARWLVALDGHGAQQLNLTTTEFLGEWLDGLLDLPVLALPPVARERTLVPAATRWAPPSGRGRDAGSAGPTADHRWAGDSGHVRLEGHRAAVGRPAAARRLQTPVRDLLLRPLDRFQRLLHRTPGRPGLPARPMPSCSWRWRGRSRSGA